MWQKVSNDEHAHYKDFCNGRKTPDRPEIVYQSLKAQGYLVPRPKNNGKSEWYRKAGNQSFGIEKWSQAMESYNKSLCFAETTSSSSELISLAYANRSAVFFELKKFDKCLVDIDLAMKAGLPDRLKEKLEKRRADSQLIIENGALGAQFEPKLSYQSSENYPEMANVLDIKYNKRYGRHVIAKSALGVGETIVMEKAFMTAHRYEKFRRCSGCMKKDVNLIPCINCTDAMFCSNECSLNIYHRVECNIQTMPEESCNDNQLHIIRSLLQAIYTFSSVDELQSFVEDAIASDKFEIPASLSDDKSKYRAFLKLWHEPLVYNRNTFNQQVYFVYETLMQNKIIGAKFDSPRKKRFLMHLVAQHYCIINYSGNIVFDYSDDLVGWDFGEFRSVVAMYVNHSCAPNVTLVSFDGYNILVTLRPIKAGHQIYISGFRNDRLSHSTIDRQKFILARYRFQCRCERCNGVAADPSERDAMRSDECYRYITMNRSKVNYRLDGVMETEPAIALERNCVEWLGKYGQMKWTTEMGDVIDCYRRLLASKFNNIITF